MRAAFVCTKLPFIPLVFSALRRPSSLSCVQLASGERELGSSKEHVTVTSFVTDVEGNMDYFNRFVEISEVLSWSQQHPQELSLADGAALVFGGDALDKGVGDIRFTKALLNLAQRYPGRVEFLLGNRDVNKLRVPSELHEACLRDDRVAEDPTFPYWLPAKDRVTPKKFLSVHGMENTQANRLRWMLKETMGADGAFERRAAELGILRGIRPESVLDEDVVTSYLTQVMPGHPDSFMLEYLAKGKLLHQVGSCLFVHGAVNEENYGTVPGSAVRDTSLDSWIENLNNWARRQVDDYIGSKQHWAGKNTAERAGHALMDYGVPGGNGGKTVVYGRWDPESPISAGVQRFLADAGVSTVVCGHTPVGNSPAVAKHRGVTIVSGDTSYSDFGHASGWGIDNRGAAVSEVLAHPDGSVRVHGLLQDGSEIDYTVGTPAADEAADICVGTPVGEGWVVRAEMRGDGGFLLSRGLRPVQYRKVGAVELRGLMSAPRPA